MTQIKKRRTHGSTERGNVFGAFPFIIASIGLAKSEC